MIGFKQPYPLSCECFSGLELILRKSSLIIHWFFMYFNVSILTACSLIYWSIKQIRPVTAAVAYDVPLATATSCNNNVLVGPIIFSLEPRKSNSLRPGEKTEQFPVLSCDPMQRVVPSWVGYHCQCVHFIFCVLSLELLFVNFSTEFNAKVHAAGSADLRKKC